MRASIIVLLAACADVPQPFDLDHARVMAVRVEPPAIVAGETARVDVLVTDSSAQPRETQAFEILVTPELAPYVQRGDAGWQITAPDELVLAEPIVVAFDLVVDTADGPLRANKTIELGRTAQNPIAPAITLDGVAGELAIPIATRSFLGVEPMDPALSYRWFSSVGDLVGYTRAEARIEPEAVTEGTIAVVVRDDAGGTAWTIVPATTY
jgi:hypothetical protein